MFAVQEQKLVHPLDHVVESAAGSSTAPPAAPCRRNAAFTGEYMSWLRFCSATAVLLNVAEQHLVCKRSCSGASSVAEL